jgi:hypothetical protein
MPLWQTAKDILGVEPRQQKVGQIGSLLDADTGQNRITMIGTQGSGKSVLLSHLLIAGDRLVEKTPADKIFRLLVNEGSSNLEHDKCAMRAGNFPPKTAKLKATSIEPGLTFEWANVSTVLGQRIETGKKVVKMPIADLAGEDLCQLIEKVNAVRTLQDAEQLNAQRVTNIVTQSSAFLFIVKASRLQGLDDVPIEEEPTDVNGMSIYSDANFKRMLDGIVRYKRQNRNSPPIRSIGFVITAWDTLEPVAKQIQAITGEPFDPTDAKISQESLGRLVTACLRSTSAAIKSLEIPNVKYFPSWVETKKDVTTGKEHIVRNQMFEPGRRWDENVNSIKYSEAWDWRIIDWIKETATVTG